MKALKNVAGGMGTVGELFGFLWTQKQWWLIPFVVMLLLVAVLLLVGEVTGVAPFIYTLF
jgi:ABC-type methionine transport system permease subunit